MYVCKNTFTQDGILSFHFQPSSGLEKGEVQKGSHLVSLNTFDF